MYFFIGFLLLLALLWGLCIWRRRKALKEVCCMPCREKQELLNTILEPFGYCYVGDQDLISTRNDAWQRQAGYTALFDRAALHLHMVFDALPVYFDYHGRTWLIELWKGQYGVSAGAEVGVYHANRLLLPEEYDSALFQAVSDRERLPVSFRLQRGEELLASMSRTAWWLTAFLAGTFVRPEELTLEVSIDFPSREMQRRFLDALNRIGQEADPPHFSSYCHEQQVQIRYSYGCPSSLVRPGYVSRFRGMQIRWAQVCNRFFCKLYCRITRPFDCTLDRILYLYELLPFILRRMLRRLKGVIRA